jgi:hypothetical protein
MSSNNLYNIYNSKTQHEAGEQAGLIGGGGGVMFENKTRVLLILPQDMLDQARVMAGKAMTTLKLPVSLQIVLRALIEEGLKRDGDGNLFANVEGQAQAVRRIRSLVGRGRGAKGERRNVRSGTLRGLTGSERQRRRK